MIAKRKAACEFNLGEDFADGSKLQNYTTPLPPENQANKATYRQMVKRSIVFWANWGFLPISTAEWLIRQGGLAND